MVFRELGRDAEKNKGLYLMMVPVVLYFFIFHYMPMYGNIIAFKRFIPTKGVWGSPWIGFDNFIAFFESYYFVRLLKNTVLISLYNLAWGFPAPIILALMLNEMRMLTFKRVIQTVTYLPHFVSLVVVCGLIVDFSSTGGLANDFFSFFGFERVNFLARPELFRTVYIASGIWQEIGWYSIIYLAALSGIDPQLYEAATIDGANRWKKMVHITLPALLPVIATLLILRIGNLLNVGFEKIILLYNPLTYITADVISTFVYRKGILDFDYSYATAVGLFNNAISFLLLLLANWLSKRFTESSLW